MLADRVFLGAGVRTVNDRKLIWRDPGREPDLRRRASRPVPGSAPARSSSPASPSARSALVGAGSVVTRDIPAGSVAYGVPARVRRQREQHAAGVVTSVAGSAARWLAPLLPGIPGLAGLDARRLRRFEDTLGGLLAAVPGQPRRRAAVAQPAAGADPPRPRRERASWPRRGGPRRRVRRPGGDPGADAVHLRLSRCRPARLRPGSVTGA